jgi:hypothetical protein
LNKHTAWRAPRISKIVATGYPVTTSTNVTAIALALVMVTVIHSLAEQIGDDPGWAALVDMLA